MHNPYHFHSDAACSIGPRHGALETLIDHLDDHLVLAGKSAVREGNICRLTTFSIGDTALYAGVTTSGTVVVGRLPDKTKQFPEPARQTFDGFDAVWDEIISLAVTGTLSVSDKRRDLFVVTRRSSRDRNREPVVEAYHGVVWLDADGNPKLRPALDDQDSSTSRSWSASPAHKLPEPLCKWNYSCAFDIDPFDPFPSEELVTREGGLNAMAWDRIRWVSRQESVSINAVRAAASSRAVVKMQEGKTRTATSATICVPACERGIELTRYNACDYAALIAPTAVKNSC